MATIFKLIIEDDEGKTTVYPLADGSVSIGRREGNTIRLMERNVSRRHARLMRGNGAVFIEDLDSYNGIKINGERIAGRYEVREGDLVEIGDYHLALQRTEVADAPAHPDGWAQAGTLQEIQLPNELTQDARANRDTVIDQPAPPSLAGALAQTVGQGALDAPLPPSQPLVKPPPRGATGGKAELPPFPGPGGLPAPKSPMFGESSQATEAVGRHGKLAVGPAYQSSVPRLVCVSTSYAGKEFALTRPELIIGRVEDNDIVIEHRSVSRNHAKILFDGRTHKIIDLQSANGILVNGEEYAMTDLRKGDLIELGHVRFRFIPADEAFEPTDEEIREMREAGVEPPKPVEATPKREDKPLAHQLVAPSVPAGSNGHQPELAIPAYDPSTAATVTDTPMNALGLGDLAAPRVSAAPAAPRATDDLRPTEVNTVKKRPSAVSVAATVPDAAAMEMPTPSPRSDTRLDDYDDDVPVRPAPAEAPKKTLLYVIAGLLVTAVVLAFLVFSGGGSKERQSALQRAFEAKDWAKVVAIYNEDPTDFAEPKAVVSLYTRAVEELAKSNRAPAGGAEVANPPPTDHGEDPEPLEPAEPDEDLPPGDAAKDDDAAAKPVKEVRRRVTPRAPRPRLSVTDQLEADGRRALLAGELSTAEKLLLKCVAEKPNHASCHRLLGVLYASKDDTERSLQHYKKYVELKPSAPDADRVRKIIADAEGGASGANP
ncbi:MAG: FHA domain-containing protein [Myxococcales bacterium]|nr:FHA domain-containing protein [Myxococcales bacterium]